MLILYVMFYMSCALQIPVTFNGFLRTNTIHAIGTNGRIKFPIFLIFINTCSVLNYKN